MKTGYLASSVYHLVAKHVLSLLRHYHEGYKFDNPIRLVLIGDTGYTLPINTNATNAIQPKRPISNITNERCRPLLPLSMRFEQRFDAFELLKGIEILFRGTS